MPSDNVLAARVQAELDIPLNRFLGMRLRDPADPSAGIQTSESERDQWS